jgi:AAA-like domain
VLRSMSEMRLARLCFAPSGGDRIDAEGWTTVFTLGGLTLPESGLKRDDYSYEQRLSVALLYLVSQFARRLLNDMDRRIPKAIVLDEAWAVTSTPQGAKLIPEVSRMGRSRNTALILVSQNASDLLNEQVTNCISAVFAFRSTERAEVASVMSLLGVEPSDEHSAALRSLGNAECIFRDLDGRAGRMIVDLISDDLRRWLDTNPTRARSDEAPLAPGRARSFGGRVESGRTESARPDPEPFGNGHPPGRMLGHGFPAASSEQAWARPTAGPMQASHPQTPSQLARAD